MVAPPYFAVPPNAYGGVEAVVADLVDALVDRGHEVVLVGAGRRGTRAQHFHATYQDPPGDQLGDPLPEVLHAARTARFLDGVDVDLVHDHTLAGPLMARGRRRPTVVTVHGPVNGEPGDYYRALDGTAGLIAISDAQRSSAPDLAWVGTVHNALRVGTFPFRRDKEDFALFLGRFSPDKGAHLAIDAARQAGLRLVLAGKCAEPIEHEYFARQIAPRLGADTTMFGTADAREKRDLLARAACLLAPVCWEEPFGLVMIEAMACGTPVVALRRGAVPEVVVHGITGMVVDDPAGLPAAIHAARALDPAACRSHVERHFSVEAMAGGYERAYRHLLGADTFDTGTGPSGTGTGPFGAANGPAPGRRPGQPSIDRPEPSTTRHRQPSGTTRGRACAVEAVVPMARVAGVAAEVAEVPRVAEIDAFQATN
ncbi:MAG: glycosyltransferase family 4 protein [Acidimicrobiales bacterium]